MASVYPLEEIRVIWKYKISLRERTILRMFENSKVLTAAIDLNGDPCIWVEINPNNEKKYYELLVFGTGDEIVAPETLQFINTFFQGQNVWHLYQRIDNAS